MVDAHTARTGTVAGGRQNSARPTGDQNAALNSGTEDRCADGLFHMARTSVGITQHPLPVGRGNTSCANTRTPTPVRVALARARRDAGCPPCFVPLMVAVSAVSLSELVAPVAARPTETAREARPSGVGATAAASFASTRDQMVRVKALRRAMDLAAKPGGAARTVAVGAATIGTKTAFVAGMPSQTGGGANPRDVGPIPGANAVNTLVRTGLAKLALNGIP